MPELHANSSSSLWGMADAKGNAQPLPDACSEREEARASVPEVLFPSAAGLGSLCLQGQDLRKSLGEQHPLRCPRLRCSVSAGGAAGWSSRLRERSKRSG